MHWEHKFAQRTTLMKRSTVREILKHAADPKIISFAGGLPAPELFPIKETAAASERFSKNMGARRCSMAKTRGGLELREYAETFSQGDVVLVETPTCRVFRAVKPLRANAADATAA